MTHYFDPKDSKQQVKNFAWKVLRRLHAAGAKTLQIDDIEQELWVIWCGCCDTYNSEFGAKFSTYLHNGMRQYINSFARKHVSQRHAEVIALSLDAPAPGGSSEDMDTSSLGDAIPAVGPSPDKEVEETSAFNYVLRRLSPRAQQFVTILRNQPQELLEEVLRLEDKARYAKQERNITVNLSHRLTYVMILDLMDAGRTERKQILDEVAAVSDHYCQQVA